MLSMKIEDLKNEYDLVNTSGITCLFKHKTNDNDYRSVKMSLEDLKRYKIVKKTSKTKHTYKGDR